MCCNYFCVLCDAKCLDVFPGVQSCSCYLLQINNTVSFGDFRIVLVSNFEPASIFLNFFGFHVLRSFFVIKCFFRFSISSVFNAIFKFVERKLMISIASSSEGNNIFVIVFVFPRLK